MVNFVFSFSQPVHVGVTSVKRKRGRLEKFALPQTNDLCLLLFRSCCKLCFTCIAKIELKIAHLALNNNQSLALLCARGLLYYSHNTRNLSTFCVKSELSSTSSEWVVPCLGESRSHFPCVSLL